MIQTAVKIKSVPDLVQSLKVARLYGLTVVFTNGCFDLLHAGHVDYLEQTKALGDLLIVGVNSDRSVRRLKGPARPITLLAERQRLLAALTVVDLVTSFDADTPLELIRQLRPDIIVKGSDWAEAEVVGGEFVKSYGGTVRLIPAVHSARTSAIIGRILRRKSCLDATEA